MIEEARVNGEYDNWSELMRERERIKKRRMTAERATERSVEAARLRDKRSSPEYKAKEKEKQEARRKTAGYRSKNRAYMNAYYAGRRLPGDA